MRTKVNVEEESSPAANNQPVVKTTPSHTTRYRAETELLHNAISGDPQATQRILQYLSSSNTNLRHIMLAALHESRDLRTWCHLLTCLALRCWTDTLTETPYQPVSESDAKAEVAIQRTDAPAEQQTAGEFEWQDNLELSIVEAFIIDEEQDEGALKTNILHTATQARSVTDDTTERMRFAAAYLLGLRGDLSSFPILDEMIDSVSRLKPARTRRGQPQFAAQAEEHRLWGVRAVRALAALQDARSAPPLVKALAVGHQIGYRDLHLEARRALGDLGPLAEAAWLEALSHPNSHIRWHAARGLGQIGNPHALDILAKGLFDENQEVRWATARVLAQLDTTAVPAILTVLCQHPLNQPFREAAYHALNAMPSSQTRSYLKPLLDVLQSSATSPEAPAVAQRMLAEWKRVEEMNYD